MLPVISNDRTRSGYLAARLSAMVPPQELQTKIGLLDAEFVEQRHGLGRAVVPHGALDDGLRRPPVLEDVHEEAPAVGGEQLRHLPEVRPTGTAGATSVQEDGRQTLPHFDVVVLDAVRFRVGALRGCLDVHEVRPSMV